MLTLVSRLLRAIIRRLRIRRHIRVHLIGASGDLALVYIRQGLLGRLLFLETETEMYLARLPLGGQWVNDGTQRAVNDRGLIEAVERQRDQLELLRQRMGVSLAGYLPRTDEFNRDHPRRA